MRGCTLKTLFIDSSRKSLSVALANEDKLVFVSNVNSYSKHSNFLMNEISKILNKFNLKPEDIDNYVILNGPGSFTGVRVGVTVSKTLAWTLSKKIFTINNLEALKVGIKDDIIISVIPDKNDFSYVGIYGDKTEEKYLSIDDDLLNIHNKSITIVSMESSTYLNNLIEKLSKSNDVKTKIIDDYDYINVINYALSKESINPHLVKPLYLKKIDAEKKKNDN